MSDAITSLRSWSSSKVAAAVLVGMVLIGGTVLAAPSVAVAGAPSNSFTFKGAYSGTLKLSPSTLTCMSGKTYSGKGYLVTLSHMTGAISGAGSGPWAMSLYVPKLGTTKVSKADVKSLTDSSLQSNGFPIIAFDETAGTITDNGSKGTVNLSVQYHKVGGSYGKTATVTGSWSC
ncbi:MAG TPA: hypothetical protein VIJ34_02005 [Acidimicrobiales bacterium]